MCKEDGRGMAGTFVAKKAGPLCNVSRHHMRLALLYLLFLLKEHVVCAEPDRGFGCEGPRELV
jgi:hypothetical protein